MKMHNAYLHNSLHNKKIHNSKKNNKPLIRDYKTSKVISVDINTLLNRVKLEKKNRLKENVILVGLAILVVGVVGIISLIF